MKIGEYIRSRGLTVSLVSQKMGVTRQAVDKYGTEYGHNPTTKTLEKVAKAMTELGAPTTVVDLVAATYKDQVL